MVCIYSWICDNTGEQRAPRHKAKPLYLKEESEISPLDPDLSVLNSTNLPCSPFLEPGRKRVSIQILVVEDNEMNRDMLVRRLQRRQFNILIATNGQAALDILETERPDIILMDMRMPIMDGWTAIKIIQENPNLRSIPIIGVSANGLSEDRKVALEAGCVAYETKPVDFDHLLALIHKFTKMAG